MENKYISFSDENNESNGSKVILKYISFWPFFLVSTIIFLFAAFLYLRYSDYKYTTTARIEIIDKAQDSEMALPTAMTIFNRSMINLENEIGVLSSYRINKEVVKELKSNVRFFISGRLKDTESHKTDWFNQYDLDFNIDSDTVTEKMIFKFKFDEEKLVIEKYDKFYEFQKSYDFNSHNTYNKNHSLPFDFSFEKQEVDDNYERILIFEPFDKFVKSMQSQLDIVQAGKESEHLLIKMDYGNKLISKEYIDKLIQVFDDDGIKDRQLEHKRTMEFAETRSEFLMIELNQVEKKLQNFKEKNNLTNIEADASVNISQKLNYDNELFNVQSQKDLLALLKSVVLEDNLRLLPINIGLENSEINQQIMIYNNLINERNKYINGGVGPNNSLVVNMDLQLNDYYNNIITSIENHDKNLEKTIKNLEIKESEYIGFSSNIPLNQKILRSIQRELEVKEALFLLLLQKREESAINFAVVKPSIKVVDYAINSEFPSSPSVPSTYGLALVVGFLIPFIFLYAWFMFDNKIHTKAQLSEILNDLPILGEIPFQKNLNKNKEIYNSKSRTFISESIRMIVANLKFLFHDEQQDKKVILVTSSIKGEGKTIVSVNVAASLSSKSNKVLLVGSDLRNPQIHKFIDGTSKETKGLTDYIYTNKYDWSDLLIKNDNFDILLSGTIPPNPTELLSSPKFEKFIEDVKKEYDFIVIDSAPTILVSDTFMISKFASTTIYIVRASFTEVGILDHLIECKNQNKLKNISLVLNGVGNSRAYGYQYGYNYSYSYNYNYGYGYGYSEEN